MKTAKGWIVILLVTLSAVCVSLLLTCWKTELRSSAHGRGGQSTLSPANSEAAASLFDPLSRARDLRFFTRIRIREKTSRGSKLVEVLCVVRRARPLGDVLELLRMVEGAPRVIFRADPGGLFDSFRAISYDRLLTIWQGGDHDWVRVYALNEKGDVREVFCGDSWEEPEVVADIWLILSDEPDFDSTRVPVKRHGDAWIYKWNGKTYAKVKTTPWADRFKAIRD